MNGTSNHINELWRELRGFINAAYTKGEDDDDLCNLRDYAEDISWHDSLESLLDAETANERQHRGSRSIRGFSNVHGAKLTLLNCVLRGSEQEPRAVDFLRFRKTAVEANVIGWLIRDEITTEWKTRVQAFDYAKLMREHEVSA